MDSYSCSVFVCEFFLRFGNDVDMVRPIDPRKIRAKISDALNRETGNRNENISSFCKYYFFRSLWNVLWNMRRFQPYASNAMHKMPDMLAWELFVLLLLLQGVETVVRVCMCMSLPDSVPAHLRVSFVIYACLLMIGYLHWTLLFIWLWWMRMQPLLPSTSLLTQGLTNIIIII